MVFAELIMLQLFAELKRRVLHIFHQPKNNKQKE